VPSSSGRTVPVVHRRPRSDPGAGSGTTGADGPATHRRGADADPHPRGRRRFGAVAGSGGAGGRLRVRAGALTRTG